MYEYRVWILNDEFTEYADDRYHAISQASRAYKKRHPASKFAWYQLKTIAQAKKMV